jgi:hypothetical protein
MMGLGVFLGVWLCARHEHSAAYAIAAGLVLHDITSAIWGNRITAAAYWLGRSIRDIGGW